MAYLSIKALNSIAYLSKYFDNIAISLRLPYCLLFEQVLKCICTYDSYVMNFQALKIVNTKTYLKQYCSDAY